MDERSVIRLTIPAELRFRDVAIRAVAEACRLVGRPRTAEGSFTSATTTQTLDLSDRFAAEIVSAVSEIINNIAIHGYAGSGLGEIALEITVARDHLAIQITDQGTAFDPSEVPAPELDALPERGMGIHIAKACVDQLDYTPGPPNVWCLKKYRNPRARHRPLSRPL
jgi:anti-sigma regulatory factor (Ser/Thr protein kinase)